MKKIISIVFICIFILFLYGCKKAVQKSENKTVYNIEETQTEKNHKTNKNIDNTMKFSEITYKDLIFKYPLTWKIEDNNFDKLMITKNDEKYPDNTPSILVTVTETDQKNNEDVLNNLNKIYKELGLPADIIISKELIKIGDKEFWKITNKLDEKNSIVQSYIAILINDMRYDFTVIYKINNQDEIDFMKQIIQSVSLKE